MQTFIEKFREVTDGRYDFLKLQNAEFVIDELLLSLTFAYPEEKERDVFAAVDDIKMGIKRAFDGDIDNIDIKFVKSHFDREFFFSLYNGIYQAVSHACYNAHGKRYFDTCR